jgi:hypothetical protein
MDFPKTLREFSESLRLCFTITDSTEKKVVRLCSVGEDDPKSIVFDDVVPKFDCFRGKSGAPSLLNSSISSFFGGIITGFQKIWLIHQSTEIHLLGTSTLELEGFRSSMYTWIVF